MTSKQLDAGDLLFQQSVLLQLTKNEHKNMVTIQRLIEYKERYFTKKLE